MKMYSVSTHVFISLTLCQFKYMSYLNDLLK